MCSSMSMWSLQMSGLVLGTALLVGAGCQTTPQRKTQTPLESAPNPEEGVLAQERVDEINRVCNRKAGTVVPLCWNEEYLRVKKKFEAEITLQILVSPSGQASDVKVVSSTSQSKELQDCLVSGAKTWAFPEGKTEAPVYCKFYLRSSM